MTGLSDFMMDALSQPILPRAQATAEDWSFFDTTSSTIIKSRTSDTTEYNRMMGGSPEELKAERIRDHEDWSRIVQDRTQGLIDVTGLTAEEIANKLPDDGDARCFRLSLDPIFGSASAHIYKSMRALAATRCFAATWSDYEEGTAWLLEACRLIGASVQLVQSEVVRHAVRCLGTRMEMSITPATSFGYADQGHTPLIDMMARGANRCVALGWSPEKQLQIAHHKMRKRVWRKVRLGVRIAGLDWGMRAALHRIISGLSTPDLSRCYMAIANVPRDHGGFDGEPFINFLMSVGERRIALMLVLVKGSFEVQR